MSRKLSNNQIAALAVLNNSGTMIVERSNWNDYQCYRALIAKNAAQLIEENDHSITIASMMYKPVKTAAENIIAKPEVVFCTHCGNRYATTHVDDLPYCQICANNITTQRVKVEAKKTAAKKPRKSVKDTFKAVDEIAAQLEPVAEVATDKCDICRVNVATHTLGNGRSVCYDCYAETGLPEPVEAAKPAKKERKPIAIVSEIIEGVTPTAHVLHIQPKGAAEITLSVNFDALKPIIAREIASEHIGDAKSCRLWLEGATYGYDVRYSVKKGRLDEWKIVIKTEVAK